LLGEGPADAALVIDLDNRQEWLDEAAALRQAVDEQTA
jgi:hypothetical protein